MVETGLNRINKVLIDNKYIDKSNIETILRGDIISILNNYFEFDKNSLAVNLNIDNNSYKLTINTKINRLKNVGILPNEFN